MMIGPTFDWKLDFHVIVWLYKSDLNRFLFLFCCFWVLLVFWIVGLILQCPLGVCMFLVFGGFWGLWNTIMTISYKSYKSYKKIQNGLKKLRKLQKLLVKSCNCYNHLLNLVSRNFDLWSYKNYNRFITSYRFITRL